MKSNLDSTVSWDADAQRKFWDDGDSKHLQESTLGIQAQQRGEAVLKIIQSLPKSRPKILEIGCGNGWFARRLSSIGTVHGIDISAAAIDEARLKIDDVTFEAGDFLTMPSLSNMFDVAVSLETLSHVADQAKFISLAAWSLRPGGHLVIATQNRTVCYRRSDIQPPLPGQLRRWLTLKEVRTLLERTRLNVTQLITIEPAGNTGFLRYVNSPRLNKALQRFITEDKIKKLKEDAGLGQTIIAVAQKPL
jgi:ubiquinone/menaquinone biosynthesis C-methylase UbiE